MRATVDRVLEEIRALPPPDLRVVCVEITKLVNKLNSPRPLPRPEGEIMAILNRLTGCTAERPLMRRLMTERAQERAREEAELQAYLARRRGAGHA